MTKAHDDLLDTIRQEMRNKLKELQPHVDEYKRIEEALRRLDAKKPGRPRGSRNKTTVAA
jgi:hypothetical protein